MTKPTLYAEADGNRKAWYLVCIVSGLSTDNPVRDFRVVMDEDEQKAAVGFFHDKYGLTDCRIYIGEGYFSIDG